MLTKKPENKKSKLNFREKFEEEQAEREIEEQIWKLKNLK